MGVLRPERPAARPTKRVLPEVTDIGRPSRKPALRARVGPPPLPRAHGARPGVPGVGRVGGAPEPPARRLARGQDTEAPVPEPPKGPAVPSSEPAARLVRVGVGAAGPPAPPPPVGPPEPAPPTETPDEAPPAPADGAPPRAGARRPPPDASRLPKPGRQAPVATGAPLTGPAGARPPPAGGVLAARPLSGVRARGATGVKHPTRGPAAIRARRAGPVPSVPAETCPPVARALARAPMGRVVATRLVRTPARQRRAAGGSGVAAGHVVAEVPRPALLDTRARLVAAGAARQAMAEAAVTTPRRGTELLLAGRVIPVPAPAAGVRAVRIAAAPPEPALASALRCRARRLVEAPARLPPRRRDPRRSDPSPRNPSRRQQPRRLYPARPPPLEPLLHPLPQLQPFDVMPAA